MGEESYFIDEISDYIADNVLNDLEKEFNQTVVYGRDVDVATILANAKRFPMMSNYQVVIVKEAQDVKNLIPDSKIKDDKKDKHPMEAYYENPLKSTILVLCYKYKTIDRRKTYAKSIEKHGVLYESDKLFDNQLPAWIQNFLRKKNYSIRPDAAVLLSEFLGSDLSKISNELTKLTINVPVGSEITPLHIEQNIGISKDFNVFEFQRAIGKKDVFKCNQIINHFTANPRENPNIKILPSIYLFFVKILLYHYTPDKTKNSIASALGIHPFFFPEYQLAAKNYNLIKTKKIISLLRKYDLKSKGVDNATSNDGELLKEFTYQVLH